MPSSHRANCTAPALGLPITEEPHPSSHAPRFGFSPIQVATHADHSFASGLQTYITFEGRARPAPLAVWPFGAPVLFLRCCHGRFCFAPTYPSVPPDTHTYTLTLGTHTPTNQDRLLPTIVGQTSKFSHDYWSRRLPIIQESKARLELEGGGGKRCAWPTFSRC